MKNYNEFTNENTKWVYEGDFHVDSSMVKDGRFIEGKIPDEVTGIFGCKNNKLTSLEGLPSKIGKSFYCNANNLTSLEGAPLEVEGLFDCCFNKLTSLEGGPSKVIGHFNCGDNELTTLEGSPSVVEGDFYCSHNKLTSLEGGPSKVTKFFWCSYNTNNLGIEKKFMESGLYKKDYWPELLKYMISDKLKLEDVKGWPDGFLNDNLKVSIENLNKYNL